MLHAISLLIYALKKNLGDFTHKLSNSPLSPTHLEFDPRNFMDNSKVDVPNSITYFNKTPIFKWYVVRCSSKINYQKDTCLKDIGLSAQNIWILTSLINIIVGIYMTMKWAQESSLRYFIRAPKIMRKVLWPQTGFANHVLQITCVTS